MVNPVFVDVPAPPIQLRPYEVSYQVTLIRS
jgi:hypothetical protein